MALNLTPAEYKLLLAAWQSFETQPKINSKKIAELCGYKNAATAASRWSNLKKKLASGDLSTDSDTGTKPKGKAGGGGRKRGGTDAGLVQAEMPKQRCKKAKGAGEKQINGDGEGDDEESNAKVKVEVKEEDVVDDEDVDGGLLKGATRFLEEDGNET